MNRLLGAVLAGGRARRFGSDKAMAIWRGKPLIEHAVDALRPVVDEVVLCGRPYGDIAALIDRPAADMGPLGGLNGALHHAAEHGFDAVLSVGCDTPLLPSELLDRLRGSNGPVYVMDLPVIGYWPVALAARLDAFLAEDRKHAIRAWAESVSAEPLDWPTLANVNEPADLARLGSYGIAERAPIPIERFREMIGQEVGLSDWILIDQDRIDDFAETTEDRQPIHIDPVQAARSGFGGTIAHGFLILSMLSAMSRSALPAIEGVKTGVNYGINSLRFLAPVRSGRRVRGRFVLEDLIERSPGCWQVTIAATVEIEGETKPALVAEWMFLSYLG